MSGPKDYSFSFEAVRRLQVQAQMQALQAERASATRSRMAVAAEEARAWALAASTARHAANEVAAAARRQAAAARASGGAQGATGAVARAERSSRTPRGVDAGRAAEAVRDVEQADRVRAVAAPAVAALAELAAVVGDLEADGSTASLAREVEQRCAASPSASDAAEIRELSDRVERATARARGQSADLSKRLEEIGGWRKELATEAAVARFRGDEAAAWVCSADELAADHARGLSLGAALDRAAQVARRAREIHAEAGELQVKFNVRNALLVDVIASLKEIGYFVDDPQYQDPSDPAGPVIVKASRGREEMSATVDLSETVRSVWDGVADRHCKDAFFDYVDQMRLRGVEVMPVRADLRERPILKQKGAIDLPRPGTRTAGQ